MRGDEMDSGITFTPAGITVIGALLLALSGAVGVVFKLLMAAKDAQIADMKEQRDGYKRMSESAVASLEQAADRALARWAKVGIPRPAAVEPEHNSPVTEAQQDRADHATLKARLAAAKVVLEGPEAHKEIAALQAQVGNAPPEPSKTFASTIVLEGPVVVATDGAVLQEHAPATKEAA